MSHNGEPDGTLEEVILNLRFPNTFSDEQCELYRQTFREHPENLNSYVDLGDLYGFIMGAAGPERETKQYFVKGLKYYLGEQEMAFSVLIGMYVEEIHEVLRPRTSDRDGCDILRDRILHHYFVITLPPGSKVH